MEENQEILEPVSVKQVAMKWGLYLGMVMILYSMVLQLTGQVGNQALGYVNYLLAAVLMYFAHKEFKDEGTGFMSYKQGFGIGALMSVVSSVISVIFMYIYVKFIDDSMLDIVRAQQIEELEKQGLSDAQLDQSIAMMEKFSTPEMIMGFGLFFGILFGIIVALIVSAITKNPDPAQEI